MAKIQKYYPIDATNPVVIKSISERLRLYIYALLYPTEIVPEIGDKTDKFIPADVDAGEENIWREATKSFLNTNIKNVFTAYNIDDTSREVYRDFRNVSTLTGQYYDRNVDALITAIPMTANVLMYSFFYNRIDYERAWSLLMRQSAMRQRILVPITINSITTNIPLDFNIKPTKGRYALEFDRYLSTNRIYDISYPFEIFYYDIFSDGGVYPVDEMTLYLGSIKADDSEVRNISILSEPPPIISNANPVNGSIDVAIDSSIILTFNVPMDEASVSQNFSISPFNDIRLVWDIDSLQLTIDAFDEWDATTEYTITLTNGAKSIWNVPFESDYIYTFTTV